MHFKGNVNLSTGITAAEVHVADSARAALLVAELVSLSELSLAIVSQLMFNRCNPVLRRIAHNAMTRKRNCELRADNLCFLVAVKVKIGSLVDLFIV